jgi:Skp family chaperone for outer membrane proteins
MQRTTQLVVAAGIAGAVFAAALGHLLASPAAASASWERGAVVGETKTGTVDVLGLLEVMLDFDPYKTERETETQTWNAQIDPLVAQRDAAVQSLQQLDPNNPDQSVAQALYEEYQQLDQRIRSLSQQAGQRIDQLSARQLADAYAKIHAVVQTVSEAQGVDRVYSSRMSAEGMDVTNTNVIVQEVLLRPLLRDTTAVDLTPLVRAELGIPDAPPETPAGEGPTPAPIEQPAGELPAGEPGGN